MSRFQSLLGDVLDLLFDQFGVVVGVSIIASGFLAPLLWALGLRGWPVLAVLMAVGTGVVVVWEGRY